MNKSAICLTLALFLFGLGVAQTSTVVATTVVDDLGQELEITNPPQRIVSLAPSVTELLFAVGAGPQLVAVSEHSDHPPQASALPRVANALGIDYERIVDFEPDLVIAWLTGNGHRAIKRLEQLGLRVFVTEPRRFSDIERLLSLLGRLSGHPKEGSSQALEFTRRAALLRDTFSGKPRVSVFYQISERPLMTLNGEHMVSELFTLCGGENVFHNYRSLAPTISIEDVLQRDADIILISSTVPNVNSVRDWWLKMTDLKAAQRGQVFIVDADLINRQGPRIIQGAEQICTHIDKARYKSAG